MIHLHLFFVTEGAEGSKSAEKLFKKLMTNYSPYIRPVSNDTDLVIVHLGIALSQLVDIVSTIGYSSL